MVTLKEVPRSAALAFSPKGPYLAAGTVAGVIDMNFSTNSCLEVFKADFASGGKALQLAGSPSGAPERFYRLTWGTLGVDTGKNGIIAGGLADGTILAWDASRLLGGNAVPANGGELPSTHLPSLSKHTGAVKGLEFNRVSPNLLASGGADSAITIWDLTNPHKVTSYPALKGGANGQSPEAEVTHLAWNHKVQHILANSSANGSVTIWDLRQQRPLMVLRDRGRNPQRYSAVAWHPSVATQVVVACEDDHSPVLQQWDLRNNLTPVHEYEGHSKGVLGVSWSSQDPSLLLSVGKDSRTILWGVGGQKLGEYSSASFNFDVQWSPTNAGVFSTSSYGGGDGQDGTVSLHSLASFTSPVPTQSSPMYGGGHAQTGQPEPLGRTPAWLKRPVGATFGFGGKLASFINVKQRLENGQVVVVPKITLQQVTTEKELVERSQQFEAAISGGDQATLIGFCEAKASEGDPKNAETWQYLRVHFESDGRRYLLSQLGFEDALPPVEAPQGEADVSGAAETLGQLNLDAAPEPPQLPEGDGMDFFENEAAGAFLEQQQAPVANHGEKPKTPKSQAASPRAAPEQPGEAESEIERALFVGNYSAAVDIALKAGRMADALVIGYMVGGQLWNKAQQHYFKKQPRPYMHIVQAVLENDLLALVKTRPLGAWQETLALVASHGGDDWQDLCDALARRLAAAGNTHAATLAWICASNVDQTIRTWTQLLTQTGVTVSKLQDLMERSVILGLGTQGGKVSAALSELISQYASILASQGRMKEALEYLDMVPGDDSDGPTNVLRDRIYRSGNPDIPHDAHAPPFPFSAEVAQESAAHAPAAAPVAAAPSQNDFYSQNAYRTSGTYGASSYGANTGQAYGQHQQSPPQSSYGSYQEYYNPQAYDYGGQGGQGGYAAPVGGGSYVGAPPPQPPTNTVPAAQPFVPSKAASPRYDGAYDSGYSNQAAYAPVQQPQVQQRPSQTGQSASGWAGQDSGVSQEWSQQGAYAQAAQLTAPPTQIVPHANVFMPSRSAAPGPQQVQQPGAMFVPTPSLGSIPSGGASAQYQPAPPATPPAPSTPPAPPAPTGPPASANINNVDTSKVPADLQPIVKTLKGVYARCAPAAAGAPGKKREMEDTGRRLGQLLWRLNAGDISPRVQTALKELAAALEARDFAGASAKQVALTASDWDECSTFLTGLKRLIKAAQMLG